MSSQEALRDALDGMTDAAVPACMEAVELAGIEVTVEDREALSDWLQDRFRRRQEAHIEAESAA